MGSEGIGGAKSKGLGAAERCSSCIDPCVDSQDFGPRSEASPRLRVQHPWILAVGRYGRAPGWVGQLRSLLEPKKRQLLQLLLHPPAPTLQPGLAGSPRKDSADGPQPRASLPGTSRGCPGAIELPTFWSCFQTPKQAAPKLCALSNANWGCLRAGGCGVRFWGQLETCRGAIGVRRAPVGSGELRAGSCGVSLPPPSP